MTAVKGIGAITISLMLLWAGAKAQDCNVANRVDCGQIGTQQAECEGDGCCWDPQDNEPWCFYPNQNNADCDNIPWTGASDAGFTASDRSTMYNLFEANMNVESCGAVCASTDITTDAGSYYFHWMRDAGLSLKAWMDINNDDYNTVQPIMDAYVTWVSNLKDDTSPNGIDIRVEPKFEIPSGVPFTGGWCRPQSDGPALRAMALTQYAHILHGQGLSTDTVYDLISHDLSWVVSYWNTETCDLWEDLVATDLYWNRMTFIFALNRAADLADLLGKSDGDGWRNAAASVLPEAQDNWNGAYIEEEGSLRAIDGAVLHAIATFGEYLYPPDSSQAASTIDELTKTFCNMYQINQDTVSYDFPGILVGRYVADTYSGGNPWQLLTAALAEDFYLGATATLKKVQSRGENPILDEQEDRSWMKLLKIPPGSRMTDLAVRQMEAGDATMTRLYSYVNGDGMRIDEQIDKNTGKQANAEGLTWSYANILHALWVRDNTLLLKEQVMDKY